MNEFSSNYEMILRNRRLAFAAETTGSTVFAKALRELCDALSVLQEQAEEQKVEGQKQADIRIKRLEGLLSELVSPTFLVDYRDLEAKAKRWEWVSHRFRLEKIRGVGEATCKFTFQCLGSVPSIDEAVDSIRVCED